MSACAKEASKEGAAHVESSAREDAAARGGCRGGQLSSPEEEQEGRTGDGPSDCCAGLSLVLCADRVLEVEGDDVGLRGWRKRAGEDLVEHLAGRAGNVEEGALRWSWRCWVGKRGGREGSRWWSDECGGGRGVVGVEGAGRWPARSRVGRVQHGAQ